MLKVMRRFPTGRKGMIKRIAMRILLILMVPALSGCWYVAAAGAGAYGGYKMKEKGYKTQSPITKEQQRNKESKDAD
jgi:hypothetical protein